MEIPYEFLDNRALKDYKAGDMGICMAGNGGIMVGIYVMILTILINRYDQLKEVLRLIS